MKRNFSLDFLKFIAIFSVIYTHCVFYDSSAFAAVSDSVLRFPVPVFFMIAGFYSYFNDYKYGLVKYKARIRRLVKLAFAANIFYLAVFFSFDLFTFRNFFIFIFFNESPFAYHLWFIQALLYVYIIYYFLTRLDFDLKRLYKIVPFLLIANLCLGEASNILGVSVPFYYYRNFLFTGLPFFILGYYIHDNINAYGDVSDYVFSTLILLSIICITLETLCAGNAELYVGVIFLSILLFVWCVLNPNKLNFGIFNWIGGNLYMYIYVLHVVVLEYLKIYLPMIFNPLTVFLITIAISLPVFVLVKFKSSKDTHSEGDNI